MAEAADDLKAELAAAVQALKASKEAHTRLRDNLMRSLDGQLAESKAAVARSQALLDAVRARACQDRPF